MSMAYSGHWDMLRLCGFKPTHGWDFAQLPHGYHLGCDLKTASGNGGKIVNRYAAETIIRKCLPMRLPHDVTLFYDWPIGIREISIRPFPIQFNDPTSKGSNIGAQPKHPFFHPLLLSHLTKLPYKIISRGTRKISRIRWAMQYHLWPPLPVSSEQSAVIEFERDTDFRAEMMSEQNRQGQRKVA